MSDNLCRLPSCRRPIVLSTTDTGATMVLDRQQTTDGTYELRAVAFGRPVAQYVKREEGDETLRYRVHIASCAGRTAKGRPRRPGRRR